MEDLLERKLIQSFTEKRVYASDLVGHAKISQWKYWNFKFNHFIQEDYRFCVIGMD